MSGVLLTLLGIGGLQAPAERVALAMTADGRAVETAEAPPPGALAVPTPYGLLRTASHPVVLVREEPVHRDWAAHAAPVPTFTARSLVANVSGAGHLRELVELAAYAETHDVGPGSHELTVAACRALEQWGAQIDPVPAKTTYERRIPWLWHELLRDSGARALLYAGKLMEEAQSASGGDAAVGLADIRKALEHRNAFVRRAAALIAADQQLADVTLAPILLGASLTDPSAAARDGAAAAAAALWPEYARNFWYEGVARASEANRIVSAWHLARYGGAQAADSLAYVLSGYDRRAPNRYRFGDRELQLVIDVQEPGAPIVAARPGECGAAALFPIAPATHALTNVSVIKVTRHTPAITETLVKALELWSGTPSERDAAGWLRWYEERRAAEDAAAAQAAE